MYFLGVALLDTNDASVGTNPNRLEDNGYLEKLNEVLDELEKAHYLWDGKYTFSGEEKRITGKESDGAIVTESYLVQVDVDKHCPEPDCPIPQPWTAWTCHCDPNKANDDGIPLCCNDKRRRFRGCERGCDSMKCSEAKTELAKRGECPVNDALCGATSSAWTIDQWFTAPDITTGSVNEDIAVDLIISTYQSNTGSLGDLYGFTEDDVRAFLTADTYHKNIDIAEINEYVDFNCLNAGNGNLIDEFDRCFKLKNTGDIKDFHEKRYPKQPASVGDFYAIRGGPVITVDVSGKVDSDEYTDSKYYQHGAQNIYAQWENGQWTNTKLVANRLASNVYTDTDQCVRPGTQDSDETVVQCEVEDSGKLGKLGYFNDKNQRNNWALNGGVLTLATDHNTRGIVGALVDWFESFECPNEMAWEEDTTCPSRPVVVRTEDDTCVAGYQQTDPAKCAEGHIRDTLVVKIEWSNKEFFMYWNEERATGQFGDPHADNFDPADGPVFAGVSQDYLDLKAELAAAGITAVSLDCNPDECELCASPPIPCKNPCEYTTWSEWGSWAIADAVTADSQTGFASDNLAPAGGSGWFNGRDDCGEVLAQGQCFRVFENAASVANVKKHIDEAVVVLEDVDGVYSDPDKLFALQFIHSWVKDGAFVADSATFIADAEAALAADDAAAAALLFDVTFTAKYEVLTDEGFHLDIIKKWFDSAATNMAPHAWRFSCRNRNSNVKGYKARHRDPDCDASVNNPDCCGLVDLEECELPICPDWTAWSEFSECSADCQVSGSGHGYKIQGRNCEADTTTIMSNFNVNQAAIDAATAANIIAAAAGNAAVPIPAPIVGQRVVIQLPEAESIGCSCNSLLADETMDQCQTTSFISSTADQCRWKLATCNTDRKCPTKSAEVVQACPACGTQAAVEITKHTCVETSATKADWEEIEFTAAHCGIENEMTVKECDLVTCNAGSISTDCINGSRSKIVNGEIVTEFCGTGGATVWSDWTECPASCAGRPTSQQFRFSAQSDQPDSQDCPASTDPCPAWSNWSEWGECVDGNHSRSRTCDNATNGGGAVGAECAGAATEECGC